MMEWTKPPMELMSSKSVRPRKWPGAGIGPGSGAKCSHLVISCQLLLLEIESVVALACWRVFCMHTPLRHVYKVSRK
jgi:hypothetical protein